MAELQHWQVPVERDVELAVDAYVTAPRAPVVVVWPALGVPARFYRPFVQPLQHNGFSVVLADYRGQGANTPKVGRADRAGYHHYAGTDLPAVTAAVRAVLPGAAVHLLGHSLGGQLALSYAARHAAPGELAGLLLVAASTPHFRAYPGLAGPGVLLATHAVAAVASVVGYWPGDLLRLGGRQSRVLLRDWANLCRTGRFSFAGAAPYDDDIAALRLPVLAVSVEGDGYAPPSAVDALAAKLAAAQITRWHYLPDRGKVDHFRWVKAGVPIAEKIAGWVAER